MMLAGRLHPAEDSLLSLPLETCPLHKSAQMAACQWVTRVGAREPTSMWACRQQPASGLGSVVHLESLQGTAEQLLTVSLQEAGMSK